MFSCLISSKYSMTATLLSQGVISTDPNAGEYVTRQDPDTGEIIRVWQPIDTDTDTVDVEPYTFVCMARGVIDGGIRVAGTIERFETDGKYEKADYVKMSFPVSVPMSDRSRVTDIKGPDGNVIWKEEESDNRSTVFDVLGITPILDPFGQHIENLALLRRASVG